jgi:hypothetical protein
MHVLGDDGLGVKPAYRSLRPQRRAGFDRNCIAGFHSSSYPNHDPGRTNARYQLALDLLRAEPHARAGRSPAALPKCGRVVRPDRRWSPVPLHRRWMGDVVHFGKKSHVVAGNWSINVAQVAAARKTSCPSIGWGAIWVKAVALASRKWPELRAAYLPFPWPRLYLHPHAVATMVVEREWNGQRAVFFDQIKRPELLSLAEIDIILRGLKRRPVESVGGYRRLIRFSRLPFIVRRPLWSFALQWSGWLRSQYFGTYSVHSFPVRRAQVMQSTTPLSFSLIYGRLNADGELLAQVLMDHRIVDGLTSHRIMLAIEAAMKQDIIAELTAAAT